MRIVDALLQEFEHESSSTRKLLELVPQAELSWKPHEKSMTLGRLASHIAEIPEWAVNAIKMDEMNIVPGAYKAADLDKAQAIVDLLDKNVAAAKETMQSAENEVLMQTWTFKVDGNVVFQLPKVAVIRSWVFNHTYHHRGQLEVYLRLKDVQLPQVYGPTADNPSMTG